MTLLRNRALLAFMLGHFLVDMVIGMLPILYPLLVTNLHLSYVQIGLVITMVSISSSLPQPLFGYVADRMGSRWLAPLSVVWIGGAVGLSGLSSSYGLLLGLLVLAGLASAAFHPQGAMAAGLASQDRRASALSLFTLGGNMGFAVGPLVGAAVFTRAGPPGSMVVILPALLMASAVYQALRRIVHTRPAASVRSAQQVAARGSLRMGAIVALLGVMSMRAWIHTTLNNYLPLLIHSRGGSLEQSSLMLSVLLACLALGGVAAGFVSDRIGRRPVLLVSMAGLVPSLAWMLLGQGPMPMAAAIPAGLLVGAGLPVTLVMIQELLPQNMGVASGIAFGLSFAAGGVGAALTGLIADYAGLPLAMSILCVLPLLGAAAAYGLPRERTPVVAEAEAR